MALSPRERKIALLVGAVVGLYLLDAVALTPYLARREELDKAVAAKRSELADADDAFRDQKRYRQVWRDLTEGGMRSERSEAESQLLYALNTWTEESRLSLSSVKPERTATEGRFYVINMRVSGSGPQSALAKLLWRLETSPVPIRVTEMTVNAKREGSDDLQVQLGVATLCVNPDADKADPRNNRRLVASAAPGRAQ